VVTSPRTRAARRPIRVPASREIDEQTRLGQVYVGSLMRAQMRLGLVGAGLAALLLGGLPLLFAIDPRTLHVHVFGIPLPWLLLGVVVYPALCLGAWLYVRAAERNESDFTDIVNRT
jgi:hypothetical protein